MTPTGSRDRQAWATVREELRARGMRWTPQRRQILAVLEATDGHITGSELLERCRALDPATTPSTVYRTLDVLEELGVVRHSHGLDGREEFHVQPIAEHGHLVCSTCGTSREIDAREAAPIVRAFRRTHDFDIFLDHLTLAGRCASCRAANAD
jgi:Fur family ferric uptake transcriptional regulator